MSLKDALNDAMKENGSWMEKMKKDHEIQLRTQKHNVDMYRRHNDKLEKQNDKLEKQIERLTKAFKQSKEENKKLKGEKMVLHNRVCIEESANLLLRNENKKLKEEQFDNMEEKKDVCKSCKREKLSEHEFWFPVGNGEYLCCGCGMSYM